MASRGDKIRRGVFWSYMAVSTVILLCVIRELFFKALPWTLTAKTGVMKIGLPVLEEIRGFLDTCFTYLKAFGGFVAATMVLATALFIATRKTFK